MQYTHGSQARTYLSCPGSRLAHEAPPRQLSRGTEAPPVATAHHVSWRERAAPVGRPHMATTGHTAIARHCTFKCALRAMTSANQSCSSTAIQLPLPPDISSSLLPRHLLVILVLLSSNAIHAFRLALPYVRPLERSASGQLRFRFRVGLGEASSMPAASCAPTPLLLPPPWLLPCSSTILCARSRPA